MFDKWPASGRHQADDDSGIRWSTSRCHAVTCAILICHEFYVSTGANLRHVDPSTRSFFEQVMSSGSRPIVHARNVASENGSIQPTSISNAALLPVGRLKTPTLYHHRKAGPSYARSVDRRMASTPPKSPDPSARIRHPVRIHRHDLICLHERCCMSAPLSRFCIWSLPSVERPRNTICRGGRSA